MSWCEDGRALIEVKNKKAGKEFHVYCRPSDGVFELLRTSRSEDVESEGSFDAVEAGLVWLGEKE